MFNIKELILINQYVQGIKEISSLIEWFKSFDDEAKKNAIKGLLSLVSQLHPRNDDLIQAINISAINENSTAVVMLTNPNKNYLKFGHELLKLKETELERVWIILLNVLKIADTCRRNSEDPGS